MTIALLIGLPVLGGLIYGLWLAGEVGMGPLGGRVQRRLTSELRRRPDHQTTSGDEPAAG